MRMREESRREKERGKKTERRREVDSSLLLLEDVESVKTLSAYLSIAAIVQKKNSLKM